MSTQQPASGIPNSTAAIPVWSPSYAPSDIARWERDAVSLATDDFNGLRLRLETAIRHRGEVEKPTWIPVVEAPFTDAEQFLKASLALFASCGPSAVFAYEESQFLWLAYLVGDFDFKAMRAACYLALYSEMMGIDWRQCMDSRWPAPTMPPDSCAAQFHMRASLLFADSSAVRAELLGWSNPAAGSDAPSGLDELQPFVDAFRGNVQDAFANVKKLRKDAESVRRALRVRQDSMIAASKALIADVKAAGFYAFQKWDAHQLCLWCYTAADFDTGKTILTLVLGDSALLKGLSPADLLPDWYAKQADGTLRNTIPPDVTEGGPRPSVTLEDVLDVAGLATRWALKVLSM